MSANKISLLVILVISLSLQDSKATDKSEINDNLYDYDYSADKTFANSSANIADDTADDSDQQENGCTLGALKKLIVPYLPDDYEEGLNMTPPAKRVAHLNESIAIFRRLGEYGKNLTRKLEPTLKDFSRRFMTDIYSLDVSNDCLITIINLFKAFGEGNVLPLKFFDSSGNIPTGLTDGNRNALGEYDQCLDIKSLPWMSPPFRGQYCLSSAVVPIPETHEKGEPYDPLVDGAVDSMFRVPGLTDELNPAFLILPKKLGTTLVDFFKYENGSLFRFGVCIPSTCDAQDVENLINKLVFPLTRLPIRVGPHCTVKGTPVTLNKIQIVSLVAFLVVITLVVMGTWFELYSDKQSKPTLVGQLLTAFSAVSNTKSLFRESPSLTCLDGIRFFFLVWIMFIHTYAFTVINFQSTKRVMQKEGMGFGILTHPNYVLHRNLFIIDFFFLVSGLLNSYVILSKLKKSGGQFNYVQYILFRYLKMTPTILFSIFAFWLFPLILDGPVSKEVWKNFDEGCNDGWLDTMLYIHNFKSGFPAPYMCNPPTWSIAAEFHLFALAPIVFLKMHSSPRWGLAYGLLAVIIGVIAGVVPKFLGINHYFEWRMIASGDDLSLALRYHFFGSNAHAVSYALGLVFGYFLRHYPNIKLNKYTEIAIWIISLTSCCGAIYWSMDWFLEVPNPTSILLFMIFSKILWCAGWIWIIYTCVTGRAKVLNSFLSLNGFRPWTRLSLGFVVIHTLPIMYRFSINRYALLMTDYSVISGMTFDFLISFALAYVLYILIEGPSGNLITVLLMPKRKPKEKDCADNGVGVNLETQITRL